MGINPLWLQAGWPIALFIGGLLWMGGRHKGSFEGLGERQKELEASYRILEERDRVSGVRLDRIDLRLTATETNVINQGRILDRIESKLDRLIESRMELR